MTEMRLIDARGVAAAVEAIGQGESQRARSLVINWRTER